LKKQYFHFRDNNICIGDFLSYLLNVICQMSGFFTANARRAAPKMEHAEHVMILIKGICIFHGIEITDHRFEEIKDSLH